VGWFCVGEQKAARAAARSRRPEPAAAAPAPIEFQSHHVHTGPRPAPGQGNRRKREPKAGGASEDGGDKKRAPRKAMAGPDGDDEPEPEDEIEDMSDFVPFARQKMLCDKLTRYLQQMLVKFNAEKKVHPSLPSLSLSFFVCCQSLANHLHKRIPPLHSTHCIACARLRSHHSHARF
jgi:hypothetical protein